MEGVTTTLQPIVIEKHEGIYVVRDDKLTGGTKSVLMPSIIGADREYVYASPVYGGFQIALSAYCQSVGKEATIFCAKRTQPHRNTIKCREYGAKVIEVPFGYLSVVEKAAKDYCAVTGAHKLVFGANTPANIETLAHRVRNVIEMHGGEPDEIWCAIGSGTLVESILAGTKTAKVFGVQVGAEYTDKHERLTVLKYHKGFDKPSKRKAPFPSTENYDLKAWEYCTNNRVRDSHVIFWNVL